MKSGTKSRTRPPRDIHSGAPDFEEPCRSGQKEMVSVVQGSPVSAMVSATNGIVLGMSPAMTIAGAYLGTGLAAQLGFLSSANQYQQQSIVAMAAAAKGIKRQQSRVQKKHAKPEPQSSNTSMQVKTETPGAEDAQMEAENAMRQSGF